MPFMTCDDGVRLFYRREGPRSAPAVVFSNSLGCDHMMWQPQADALKPRFQVIRYDQRGHGASDAPEQPWTLERLGADALAIAGHLGIDRFSFCGLSMGGLTGQWLGVNAADRLDRLIIADTSVSFPPAAMWDERIALVNDKGMAALADLTMSRFFTESFFAAAPDTVSAFREVFCATAPAGYTGSCHALRDADMSAEIAAIKTPVLVISGRHDPSTPPERGEFIAGQIAGARHHLLDAAHISNVEQAAGFTAALLEFLGETGLPRDERFSAGMARRRAILGDHWVDRSLARRNDFNADFQDLITRYAWGEIWTRPGLDETRRRLLVLSITAALGRWEEFDLHTRAALDAGVSTDTLKEVLLQCAVYAGVPVANTGFARAQAIMDDMA